MGVVHSAEPIALKYRGREGATMTLSPPGTANPANMAPVPNDVDEHGLVKEVRLQLPVRVHVYLHRLKLTRGQPIRDSVIAAVAAYFASHPVTDLHNGISADSF